MKKIILFLLVFVLVTPAWGMKEIGYDNPIHQSKTSGMEAETAAYMSLPTPSSSITTANNYIRLVKYSTGVTLASITANVSSATGYYFITNCSVDLRWTKGFYINLNDGAAKNWKALVSGVGTGETGTQLHTDASCTSDPNGNEANATTGWSTYHGTMSSSGVDKMAGSFSLLCQPDVAGENNFSKLGNCPQRRLAKTTFNIRADTPGDVGVYNVDGDGGAGTAIIATGGIPAIWTAYSTYWTNTVATTSYTGIRLKRATSSDAFLIYVDNLSGILLSTPSLYGVTTGTPTVDSGFNYNAASFVATITRD